MEEGYKTILTAKEVLIVVKKSKFIGNIEYVKNKEEAVEFSTKIKEKYKDATHNVVAYIIKNGGIMYCTDDKEPHGTAGKPILEVLKKNNIFDVCVVVTRYFGGVLLGTGGLCFSYSSCCKEVLKQATFARCCLCEILRLEFSYKNLNKIENIILAYNITKLEKKYNEYVYFLVVVEEKECLKFKNALMEATNGEIKIIFVKKEWERIKI